jgi:hypothetical protein
VSNVVGVPAGPVQLVNVHVTVPKLDGSACATATVVAAITETHARAARNGLGRFISLLPRMNRAPQLQPPVGPAILPPAPREVNDADFHIKPLAAKGSP